MSNTGTNSFAIGKNRPAGGSCSATDVPHVIGRAPALPVAFPWAFCGVLFRLAEVDFVARNHAQGLALGVGCVLTHVFMCPIWFQELEIQQALLSFELLTFFNINPPSTTQT